MKLFLSPRHPCSYLAGRIATNAFVNPRAPVNSATYSILAKQGFRRTGPYVYRPACETCQSCIPARVPVAAFAPDRSQRRTWRKNADLMVTPLPAQYRETHFRLYRRYLLSRHGEGEMDPDDVQAYRDFLITSWANTRFLEFRAGHNLLAVAVVDYLTDALSAVYTFFEPRAHRRSLGTYAVLFQIELARRLGLPYVYLGYWIAESKKMRYKANFSPLEIYRAHRWRVLDEVDSTRSELRQAEQ